MSINLGDLSWYIKYLSPPLIGAFIGYLTNKIAIRMLFRPLKAWRIFGLRLPMTPGVIPSRRHELARNIGEMVGEHLLTSEEVGKALMKEKFQEHLLGLIKERVGAILHRDLGPLPSLVPQKFASYFDVAVRAITYQTKDSVHKFIRSEEFSQKVEKTIATKYERLLSCELNALLTEQERRQTYIYIEERLALMLTGPTMNQWVSDFIYSKVHDIMDQEKSLHDILPAATEELLLQTIEDQTPFLLSKVSEVLEEPAVRDRIVRTVRRWIEDFIGSLGPMASMVGSFMNMEAVEGKIHRYLIDKKEDIVKWLQNEEIRERVASVVRGRCIQALQTPLVHMIRHDREAKISSICDKLSLQVMAFLREKETAEALSLMIRDNMETSIQGGALPLGELLNDLFGKSGKERLGAWLKVEGIALLRTKETVAAIDSMMETMIQTLLEKPVGRLSNILPAGVRDGIYFSIRKMASEMLATEVPGLVSSLNIKSVITEKVDSLDLLKLEKLLLSIMEEQFKYINLFGALLGFLIGCANLILL